MKEGWIGVVNTTSLLQKGATRGGNLPHVFHEGVQSDLNPDHRGPTNNKTQQKQSKHQQGQQLGKTVAIKQGHLNTHFSQYYLTPLFQFRK